VPYEGRDEDGKGPMRDDCLTELGYDRSHVTYLFQSDAWKDLRAFFHLENPFHVSITRIYRHVDKFMSQKVVESLFQKNTRRCGIWDQQEALEDGYFGMHKPAVSLGEDPDEVIRYIGGLFQEKE
jgi:hypothetical protein